MQNDIKPGMKGEARTIVSDENSAAAYGVAGIDVFATPALVGLVELAAQNAVKEHLPPGWATVGMEIKLKHLAPTPKGMGVVARATLEAIDGRRLMFSVEAQDEKELIACGQHHRFIVNLDKFLAQAKGTAG